MPCSLNGILSLSNKIFDSKPDHPNTKGRPKLYSNAQNLLAGRSVSLDELGMDESAAREELKEKVKELHLNKIGAICSEVGIGSCFW